MVSEDRPTEIDDAIGPRRRAKGPHHGVGKDLLDGGSGRRCLSQDIGNGSVATRAVMLRQTEEECHIKPLRHPVRMRQLEHSAHQSLPPACRGHADLGDSQHPNRPFPTFEGLLMGGKVCDQFSFMSGQPSSAWRLGEVPSLPKDLILLTGETGAEQPSELTVQCVINLLIIKARELTWFHLHSPLQGTGFTPPSA